MTLAVLLLAATFTRSMERVASMDPMRCQAVYDSKAIQLVYETPLEIDYRARPYELVPGACELPTVSSNQLVYTFRMRSTELTAGDMVRSLERLRDPALVSPNGWYLKAVDTIVAKDPRTVEITMRRRQVVFPWIMAMSGAAILKPDGSGTGPFKLTHWRKNHEMVFARRLRSEVEVERAGEKAAEGGTPFDTVRYLVIDDASTRWLMFLRGELDFLGEISRDEWDAVVRPDGSLDPRLTAQGITLEATPSLDAMYLGINMKDPVLGPNKKLRQALNCAFDFPAWSRFYANRICEIGGPVPAGVAGALPAETFPYRFDLAKARRLLAEAGYPNGIDPKTGRRLVLTLAQGRASQDSREAAELLASFYEKVGIRLEGRFYTWDAFLRAVNEGNVQMFQMGWVGDYPDAENFLQLFHSSNVSPGANHANYASADFDRAYDAAEAATDTETRLAAMRRAQEIVREDCPWVFTHSAMSHSLVRARVGNYVPTCFPYGQEKFLTCRDPKEK